MEKRNFYGALIDIAPRTGATIRKLVDDASNAEHIDEHGSWEFGAEFDSKGRGYAINWDVYGVGRDIHTGRMLAVIQIRKWEKQSRHGYADVHKSYFLLGRNEDDNVFAHSVPSRTIHHAVKIKKSVVKAVQDWIFGTDYKKVIRQGDIALVPLTRAPVGTEDVEGGMMTLEESHDLKAEMLTQNSHLYALNPSMNHEVHPHVEGLGWHRIMIGRRSGFHDFAAPTID